MELQRYIDFSKGVQHGQGAAEGHLDGPIQGNPLASQAVLDTLAEINVTL